MADSANLDLAQLGTELSRRLVEFEKRLAALPNKCDHYVVEFGDGCVPEYQLGPHSQGVGFKREGKDWRLYFVEVGKRERDPTLGEQVRGKGGGRIQDSYVTWIELNRVSLVAKGKVATLLPRLVEEMQAEYAQRVQTVVTGLASLESLDLFLPPLPEEGV